MTPSELLIDGFARVHGIVLRSLTDVTEAELLLQPDPGANSIAWLIWHLSRGQDKQVSDLAGVEDAWTTEGWADRFALPLPATATGYGHGPAEVAAVRASAEHLRDYHEAVHARTVAYLESLGEADLDRIVDTNWNPPVSAGVRLVSVLADGLQHAGQVGYLLGHVRRVTAGDAAER